MKDWQELAKKIIPNEYNKFISGRKLESVKYSNMIEDAMRRDLTINALYYDIDEEKIIDLVGGLQDIKNGRVRTVGEPEKRMFDDRLRVMRAIRFKNVIGGDLDTATQRAIMKYSDMPGVSNERIRDEFYSGLAKSKSPETFLNDLNQYGILSRMFPKMKLNLKFENGLRNPVIIIGLLLRGNDIRDIENMMTEMKYEKDEKKSIRLLHKFLEFFRDFSINELSIDAEADKFNNLLDYRISGLKSISNDEFMSWSKINGINDRVSRAFLDFTKRSPAEMPEIQSKIESGELPSKGKELGDEGKRVNLRTFLESI